tara:strand:+ start:642 stop:971 length:330 start_codon:yes stop_codon:yes gene_type:complete
MNYDEKRDIAIRCVDQFVKMGICKNCIDTDDDAEFEMQDIIFNQLNIAIPTNYFWSESVIIHFQFESCYKSKEETIKSIALFVANKCSLEEDETEEMLVKSLTDRIFKQ